MSSNIVPMDVKAIEWLPEDSPERKEFAELYLAEHKARMMVHAGFAGVVKSEAEFFRKQQEFALRLYMGKKIGFSEPEIINNTYVVNGKLAFEGTGLAKIIIGHFPNLIYDIEVDDSRCSISIEMASVGKPAQTKVITFTKEELFRMKSDNQTYQTHTQSHLIRKCWKRVSDTLFPELKGASLPMVDEIPVEAEIVDVIPEPEPIEVIPEPEPENRKKRRTKKDKVVEEKVEAEALDNEPGEENSGSKTSKQPDPPAAIVPMDLKPKGIEPIAKGCLTAAKSIIQRRGDNVTVGKMSEVLRSAGIERLDDAGFDYAAALNLLTEELPED